MIPRYFTHYKFVSEAVKREGLSANQQNSNSYCSDGAGVAGLRDGRALPD